MARFDNKVAVITGGSTGMGLATAKLLAGEGAQVYLTGRRAEALDEAVAEIGEQATGVQGDAADLGHLDRLFETVRDRHGRLDVLFASAGDGNLQEPLEAVTPDSFDQVIGVNVRGTVFAVQKAVPLMTEGGSIVINGTVGAVKGYPGTGIYSASKAALRSLVRTWAAELAGRKIRVNLMNPARSTPGRLPKPPRSSSTTSSPASPSVDSVNPMRSPPPSRSWHPATRASSPAARSSSTVAWARSEPWADPPGAGTSRPASTS